jgi:hypothetical protein
MLKAQKVGLRRSQTAISRGRRNIVATNTFAVTLVVRDVRVMCGRSRHLAQRSLSQSSAF